MPVFNAGRVITVLSRGCNWLKPACPRREIIRRDSLEQLKVSKREKRDCEVNFYLDMGRENRFDYLKEGYNFVETWNSNVLSWA